MDEKSQKEPGNFLLPCQAYVTVINLIVLARTDFLSGYEGPDSRDEETCSVPDQESDAKIWASRIRTRQSKERIRILPSSSKNSKRTLGVFLFVTFL
jgi:hypothetical protein